MLEFVLSFRSNASSRAICSAHRASREMSQTLKAHEMGNTDTEIVLRMCGVIICRNCTEKPPPPAKLPGRLRRLCHICLSAPLDQHITTSIYVNGTIRHGVTRGPCRCPEVPYFCSQDGVGLSSADTEYRRTWTWRTHYSTYLGGVGTGIGQGNEAVKCARTVFCLGAQIVDVDLECPSSFSGGPGLQGMAVDAQEHSGDEAGYWYVFADSFFLLGL